MYGTIANPDMARINAAYDREMEPVEYEEAASIYCQGRLMPDEEE